eukprot:GHVT01096106.1.p3 GENE.GHVT01096106.1~~GHVT01096106.1.p3  ORF type:complete len:118 (+),score=28.67 GHVT01096106.1:136-489(+)
MGPVRESVAIVWERNRIAPGSGAAGVWQRSSVSSDGSSREGREGGPCAEHLGAAAQRRQEGGADLQRKFGGEGPAAAGDRDDPHGQRLAQEEKGNENRQTNAHQETAHPPTRGNSEK